MGLISEQIKNFLNVQKLGFVASVSDGNSPNISPKGTIIGWDSDTLAFADIRSPDTMRNLEKNPLVEINVIDPLSRKGFLFKGKSRIIKNGKIFDDVLTHYRKAGIQSPINAIVLVNVTDVQDVISPLYDLGATEDEIKSKWKKYFAEL
ncbi:pyridoxamine 5'-phosphate oxidase family protein [Nitrosopumilus sp. K4]|uniref:pyridoxamine 5'-phosphate oxidase family protein n=1 Tax=Nitrosopumilus sp. K4 TaxID=2795383 RepID=UPI001BAD2355|nr:pyridoxamine 5'-phosphate oxidase family protein [Nitrosopumilus sp. K4]QUC63903.1 pyridoxamine 5'-phosphate oxidase family protein [Nitrosopumilus sp. K4]